MSRHNIKLYNASLEEKLDLYFLNIRKGEQMRRITDKTKMRQISLFWEIVGGMMAAYLDEPESGYLQKFLIFIVINVLNCLSHYIWASYQSNEPLAIALSNFTKDDKDFYTHLTSKKAKEKISVLNKYLTPEKLIPMVNMQSRREVLHHIYSALIVSTFENFSTSSSSYGFLIIKNFSYNTFYRYFGYKVASIKLTDATNSSIKQHQEATKKLLTTLFKQLFENLDIKSESYLPARKYRVNEEDISKIDFHYIFKLRDSKERFLLRNQLIIDLFYEENILMLTFYFSKKTKIVNQSDVFHWDHLIQILAQRLNKQFPNIILEILPNTLRIAILPTAVKNQIELSLLLPELQIALEIGARKMQQAYAHCQQLNKVCSKISLSPWQIDFYVDNNQYLQVALLNHINIVTIHHN